ncbi:NnrS family protein [Nioella ostreopsis]|jgi:uncharacterized protein involved in response to NO|uniref:NnrS family protein n=1 Tax=Nioella ostreopsis TaxID=2448479 RepID=UPI000FD8D636|nr:NnrS family protein [Nioella ostreopsis]
MTAPHRAMFLAGGSWAIVAVVAVAPETGFDLARSPLGGLSAWHAHEMAFGVAAALFAGYALTAMTSWPGRARLSSAGLAALVVLWVLARLSAAGALGPDLRLAAPASVSFMAFLTLILARSVLRSRTMRAAPLALFSLAMTGSQVAVLTGASPPHVPILGFAALLSVVGGRMVAAFTLNALTVSEAQKRRFRIAGVFGLLGSVTILAALGLETLRAAPDWLAACLLLAAAFETVRVCLWLSWEILTDGLLLMLHTGYAWLPIGLALLAIGKVPGSLLLESAALHGLAAGAIACSIYAVAARAVARRGDRLRTSPADAAGFGLLWAAAAWRVVTPAGSHWDAAAPALWCLAWAIFLARHGAALFRPAPRPVFSGPKRPDLRRADSGDYPMTAERSEAS